MPITHTTVATGADDPSAEINKAEWNAAHTNPDIADVTGLQSALDGKQPLATVLTNTTASFTTAQESKLSGIEAGADVTDSTNVAAAGAVMESDYTPSHSILVQQSGTGSPSALQVANNTLVGRLSGGGSDIDDLSAADVRTLLNVEDGADVTDTANVTSAGALMDSEVASLSGIKTLVVSDSVTIRTGASVAIHVGTSAPGSPSTGDLWVDTN